jgi:hypothetical protein
MKNLFLINEEEKNRILNLHETATKRHYLSEQQTTENVIRITESDLKKTIKKVFLREDDEALPETKNIPLGKVEAVQQALVDAGYGVGPTGVDGIFGKYTRNAVLKYQKDNGIKQTGNVGPITAGRLGVQQLTSGKTSQSQTRTATTQKKDTVKKDSKTSNKPVKKQQISKYNYSPRIDKELKYIIDRDLDDKPFFIYDAKDNLIYLFDMAKGNWFSPVPPMLVDYTSVVDGADAQQKDAEPFTHQDWCKVSGLGISPKLCTDTKAKTFESCMSRGKNKEPQFDSKTQTCSYGPAYGSLIKIAKRFIPKGIYSIGRIGRDEGYVGTGKNVFGLSTPDGQSMGAAIHGIPAGLPERLTASKDLELLLKKDISSGKVPQEYLEAAKQIANANQSFGCIGVPAKFIDNPKVKKLAPGARVFVMGESNQDFLVQNSSEFFDKLHGDGQQCVDPIMLAQNMSDNNNTAVA